MINKTPLAAAVLLASALGVSAYAWMGSEQAGGNHLDDATHADGEHHNSVAPTLHAEAASHADGEHHAAQEAETEEQGLHLTPAQIEAAGIQLVTAGPQALDEAFSLPGEIGFDQDRTAHVVPRTPGVVESVAVELGQNVKKGELLAVIASQQVSELRSELAAAQRRASLANKTSNANASCGRRRSPPSRIISRPARTWRKPASPWPMRSRRPTP